MDTSPTRPRTPPYTPQYPRNKGKRPLERSDSPASRASSIHPTETTSPAKKAAKRAALAEAEGLKVEELREGDVGYLTDVDVIYPDELEEVGSSDNDGDNEDTSGEEDEDEDAHSESGGIARRMSRLHCGDENGEANFSKVRRHRRLSKRFGSRQFKRSHSQSVRGSETEGSIVSPEAASAVADADVDAMDDQDTAAGQRRLRRRVRGPGEEVMFDDVMTGSSQEGAGSAGPAGRTCGPGVRATAPMTPEREMTDLRCDGRIAADDAMDVDEDD